MKSKKYTSDLDVINWKQSDKKWGSKKTSCGGTMKSEGCFITSVAMVFYSFGSNSITPENFLDDLKKDKKKDCPFDWLAAARMYDYAYSGKKNGTFNILRTKIFNFINVDKIPILIHVPNHLVVATGFNGTIPLNIKDEPDISKVNPGMILVNDPGSSKNKTLADVIKKRGAVDYYSYYYKK